MLEDFLGTKCGSCGRAKQSSHSFCGRCYHILPKAMQDALYKRFGEGYEAAFTDAQKYLEHPSEVPAAPAVKVKYPATSDELKRAGFEYTNDGVCRSCGAAIEWYVTPGGKKIPMSVIKPGDPLKTSAEFRQPHFADCPEASNFRRK